MLCDTAPHVVPRVLRYTETGAGSPDLFLIHAFALKLGLAVLGQEFFHEVEAVNRYMTKAEKTAVRDTLFTLQSTSLHNSEPPSGRTRGQLAAPQLPPAGRAYWHKYYDSLYPRGIYRVVSADARVVMLTRSPRKAARKCHSLNNP